MARLTTRANRTPTARKQHDFGVVDNKSRTIGALVDTWEEDFIEHISGIWEKVPGHYYAFSPWATRCDRPYGAVQPAYYFDTAEARDVAVAKYLKSAAKRATKNANAGPVTW